MSRSSRMVPNGASVAKTTLLTPKKSSPHSSGAAALGEAIGREITLVTVPKDAAIAKMKEAAASDWQIDHMSNITDVVSRGETTGDSAVLAELLGRTPNTIQVFAHDYKAAFGG